MTDETEEQTPLASILSKAPREDAPAKTEAPKAEEKPAVEKPDTAKPEGEVSDKAKDAADPNAEKDKEERTRDEKGRFVPKEEADSLKAAMKDERRKRQELERRLKESEKPKEKTDFWTDPDKALDERLAKERAEFDQRFFRISEKYAKRAHEDYDEVVGVLLEDAEDDPEIARRLFPQVSAHDDPAEFLYQQARNHKELKSFDGDLGRYRESVEQDLKKDLAERDRKIETLEKQLKELGKVKSSLNDEQSTSGAQVAEETATTPKPMGEILKRKRRA